MQVDPVIYSQPAPASYSNQTYQSGPPAGVYYSAHPEAVQIQPTAPPAAGKQPVSWMAPPAEIPVNCPPGLEYLTQVDQLLVHQIVEVFEMFTGWETCNKYRVFNTLGQQCFYAFEESGFCMRLWCGSAREFVIHIVDNFNQEVMRIHRPFRGMFGSMCACCGLCCTPEVQVEAPPGSVIGYVLSDCFYCNPSFQILDAARTPVFTIEGPCAMCLRCPCEYDFNIFHYGSRQRIGRISKQWSGFFQEMFTDADNFGISFPMELDVHSKATFLGALFLIDFLFFENTKNNDNNNGGLLGTLLS